MDLKTELKDFLTNYLEYYNERNFKKLSIEELNIDELKFFNWLIKGSGSNLFINQFITDFDSALSVYNQNFNLSTIEDRIKSFVSNPDDRPLENMVMQHVINDSQDAYEALISEADVLVDYLRAYADFEKFLQTDTGIRYQITDEDSSETILFKKAMQKNLFAMQIYAEDIFCKLDDCNAMPHYLTYECFDQFVLNLQRQYDKNKYVTKDDCFKEPQNPRTRSIFQHHYCGGANLEPDYELIETPEDNQRSFYDLINASCNSLEEEEDDFMIFTRKHLVLSGTEIEEIAHCEAVNYAIDCLFNSKRALEPDRYYVIKKDDYKKFVAKCNSSMTPETAHELADKYKDILKIYDEIVIQDKKKTHSR